MIDTIKLLSGEVVPIVDYFKRLIKEEVAIQVRKNEIFGNFVVTATTEYVQTDTIVITIQGPRNALKVGDTVTLRECK